MLSLLDALVLGLVEGCTEFLPISSTGHLILAADLLGAHGEKAKVFEIVIQTGAMFAVAWEYRRRLLGADRRLWSNLAIAFLPAAVAGAILGAAIKAQLFKAVPVAAALVAGGIVILWVEGRGKRRPRIEDIGQMRWSDALKVGLAQTVALVPGVSRAGATIIGGMLLGFSRRAATEFSFLLAVPTLLAAAAWDLWQSRALLSAHDLPAFTVGFAAAFVSAFACVRWLIRWVGTHDLRPFAWYRIAFGAVVLATAHFGWVDWTP